MKTAKKVKQFVRNLLDTNLQFSEKLEIKHCEIGEEEMSIDIEHVTLGHSLSIEGMESERYHDKYRIMLPDFSPRPVVHFVHHFVDTINEDEEIRAKLD